MDVHEEEVEMLAAWLLGKRISRNVRRLAELLLREDSPLCFKGGGGE